VKSFPSLCNTSSQVLVSQDILPVELAVNGTSHRYAIGMCAGAVYGNSDRNALGFCVQVPQGCLLVQAGQQLEALTGGYVKAGMHEVCAGKMWAFM